MINNNTNHDYNETGQFYHNPVDLNTDFCVTSPGDCAIVCLPLQIGDCSQTWRLNRCAFIELENHLFYYVKKADHPLILRALYKTKQSGAGIAALLLRLHIS